MMTRLSSGFARGLTLTVLLFASTELAGCSKLTSIPSPESPLTVQAKPPAAPRPELPPVPQPPPPPRVNLEGELLALDEALSFDESAVLSSDHHDILSEVAAWLSQHEDVTVLTIEAHSIGEGSRRAHTKRSTALATQIVDALIAEGIAPERLAAAGLGKSPDETRHVALRVTERSETGMVMTAE